MDPVQHDSASLVKTRSYEKNYCRLCELCMHKKTLLVVILCLQAPILYYLYKFEVARITRDYVEDKFWRQTDSFVNVTSATLRNNLPDYEFTNFSTAVTVNKSLQNADIPDNRVKEEKTKKIETNTSSQIITVNPNKQNQATTTVSNKNELHSETSNRVIVNNKTEENNEVLSQCPETPPDLQGNLFISFANEPHSLKETKEDNPLVMSGGYFKPKFCVARSKVAIIIPFRDRDEHLKYFLQYMHPTLQRQQLEYRIYIINQFGKGKFNRAKLMNIGYAESLRDLDFGCFVFHDVDLVLENDNAIYSCPEKPRHLSSAVDKFNYKLPYAGIFGGVTELTKDQFELVNGFANSFWGWGGEDDDMYNRIRVKKMQIMRYPITVSRYRMISHQREKGNEANPKRFELIRKTHITMHKDGLNSLKYDVISRDVNPLYTNITVEIFPPK